MNRVVHSCFSVTALALGASLFAPETLGADEQRAFKSMRFDEDYRFLADPAQRTEFWDPIKYVPIAGGHAGYLSIGGEARARVEAFENELFSPSPEADNAFFLQRYLLHGDYHPTEWLRAFGQLQSSLIDGKDNGPRPTDRDNIDVHQAFLEITGEVGDSRWGLRAGRQEMSFGSERLVSVREGTNNRRAFDALRLLFRRDAVSVDAFYSAPVEVDDDEFDDQHIRSVRFWGGYATVPFPSLPGIKLDLYYLGLQDRDAAYAQGPGREERHTVGARIFGKLNRWDFNHEGIYQFGRFALGSIGAWSVATDHGYTWQNLWGKPRLGLKAAIATGDRDPFDPDLQTLNPLFPRGNYFTEASLVGPQNFIHVHPTIQIHPARDWTFEAGVDFYWRENLNDGIYTPGGSVIYPGNTEFARFVGTDFSTTLDWQATRNLKVSAGYTHFFAGPFIRDNGGKDVDYGTVWVSYKF